MKNKIVIALAGLVLSALCFTSCNKDPKSPVDPKATSTGAAVNAKKPALFTEWGASDALGLFMLNPSAGDDVQNNNVKFTFEMASGGTGKFDGTVKCLDTEDIEYSVYAYYPYSASVTSPVAVAGTIPARQTMTADGSRQTGLDFMKAKAGVKFTVSGEDKNKPVCDIEMEHLVTFIDVSLGEVSSTNPPAVAPDMSAVIKHVTVESPNKTLAGKFTLDLTTGSMTFGSAGVNNVSADFTTPKTLADFEARMVANPFSVGMGDLLRIVVETETQVITQTLGGDVIDFAAGQERELKLNIDVNTEITDSSSQGTVVIDGVFTDWALVPAATVTGAGAMIEGKFYTDGTDLFMYVKANKSVINGWTEARFYFDSDFDNATGTDLGYKFGGDANGKGIDNMLNCDIASTSGLTKPIGRWNETSVYQQSSAGWFAPMSGTGEITGAGITNCVNGMGAINGDYYELEVQIKLATLPWDLADTFRIGVKIGDTDANYLDVYKWMMDGGGNPDPSLITIDGAFADWASEDVDVVTGAGDMTEGRYYYHDNDLYIYMKTKASVFPGGWNEVRIYFDSDYDSATGTDLGYALGGGNAGIDYYLNLDVGTSASPTTPVGKSNNQSVYQRANGAGWFEDVPGTEAIWGVSNITKCINGIGTFSGDYYEMEVQIHLDELPWAPANPCRIWMNIGDGGNTNYIPKHEWARTR